MLTLVLSIIPQVNSRKFVQRFLFSDVRSGGMPRPTWVGRGASGIRSLSWNKCLWSERYFVVTHLKNLSIWNYRFIRAQVLARLYRYSLRNIFIWLCLRWFSSLSSASNITDLSSHIIWQRVLQATRVSTRKGTTSMTTIFFNSVSCHRVCCLGMNIAWSEISWFINSYTPYHD